MPKPTNAPAVTPEIQTNIAEWQRLLKWLAVAKSNELALRNKLFSYFFPKAKEGTNRILASGLEVRAVKKYNRTLDRAALDAVMQQLPEALRVPGTLLQWVPEMVKETYKSLSDQERQIFDQALTIKEGTPELEITFAEVATAGTAAQMQVGETATTPNPKPAGKPSKPAVKSTVARSRVAPIAPKPTGKKPKKKK